MFELTGWEIALLIFEALSLAGALIVIRGMRYEYGIGLFRFLSQTTRDIDTRLSVETPQTRYGNSLVMIGMAVELFFGVLVVATSLKIETSDRREIARMQFAALPRMERLERSPTIFQCLQSAPKGAVFVTFPVFDPEAKDSHLALLDLLQRSGFDAKPPPVGSNGLTGFSTPGIVMFVHKANKPPAYATAIANCLGNEFRGPIEPIRPETTPWVGPNDILIGVSADPRPAP